MLAICAGCIKHRRGDTGAIDLVLKLANGEPYTLAEGDKAIFSVKRTCDDEDYILQKEVTHNQIVFTHEDTRNLKHGTYCYDVEVTLSDGQVFTIANGKYCLLPDITI